MSRPAADVPAVAPGNECGLTWRSSSANDAPGSTFGENRGNALGSGIERGAYSRYSPHQRKPPLPRQPGELVVPVEVRGERVCPVDLVLELSDGDVAVEAE